MNSKNNKTRSYIVSLVDSICIVISLFFSIISRKPKLEIGSFNSDYQNAMIIILLLYLVISRSYSKSSMDIFKRGYLREFFIVFRAQGIVLLSWFCYLFVTKQGSTYSRYVFLLFFFLGTITIYVARCYLKLAAYVIFRNTKIRSNCIVITVKDRSAEIVAKTMEENDWAMKVSGLIIIDEDMTGTRVGRVKVTGNYETIYDTVMYTAVDEIFVSIPYTYKIKLEELILALEKMGIVVHLNVDIYNIDAKNKTIDTFAGYNVVSFATTIYDFKSVLFKRTIDIAGSIVGLLVMCIAYLIIAPVIKLESKGPVLFSQNRVGKNGRIFKIYKFRSMYLDAEERKKELMSQNEMNGLMFKMKDDPRITKIGKFIRKTSIDELPQFWNILKGDMSMVGTRPPTVEEFNQYEARHRRRLSIKPGLTGLWQVSGRNSIDDFEDVVKYDLEYIDNWSVGLDIKLILKTIAVVFTRTGT